MKNKEIELKFVIDKAIREKIVSDLDKIAKKTGKSRMIDTYYIPYFREFEINGETMECVRIRENNGRAVLCYKKIHKEVMPVYCDEFETETSSASETEKILFALGFSVQMKIDKTRESFAYGDFEFDFDSVADVGEFMEVELKSDSASTDEIFELVKKYGLTQKDVTYDGIQTLAKRAMKK